MGENKKYDPSDESSYIYRGDAGKKIDADKETTEAGKSIGFDPEKLSDALVKIGEKIFGFELYSYQKGPAFRVIYSMLKGDGAELTFLFSRQSGKSEIVAFVSVVIGVTFPVLAKLFKELDHFKHGVKMGVFAPQLEQAETVYSRCVDRLNSDSTRMFMSSSDVGDFPTSKVKFKLNSGSFLNMQSGARQSKIESKTYNIIFIDESQHMDTDKVRKSIIPMTAATFGTIVRLGTPDRFRGDFYDTIQLNKQDDKRIKKANKRLEQRHFEYNYKEVIKAKKRMFKKDGKPFHNMYEKSVSRDKRSWGENSEQFKLAYRLEWLFDIGMFLTEDTFSDNLLDKKASFPPVTKSSFVVAGLDIASARASTVMTTLICDQRAEDYDTRPTKTLHAWDELSGLDYETQFDIISEKLVTYGVQVLFCDYTGVGRALTDRFIYHFSDSLVIVPYTFTPASKSDMWKRLDEDINNKRIIIPANKSIQETEQFRNFKEQMLNLQKRWNQSIMICHKTDGFKDDYCDSLGLANLAGNHLYQKPTEVEVFDNFFVNNSNTDSIIEESRW